MHEIILKKFDEWTRDRESREKRISIFEHIRDIPYVVTDITDPVEGPVELLIQNKGTCSPKHFLLGIMYEQLGIPIKYVSYPFVWGNQKIDFPESLRERVHKLPMHYHIALKAYINRWVLLDCTWDPPLKKVGFPANETWDGITDTVNAVEPVKEVIHESIQERLDYLESHLQHTEDQFNMVEEFFDELNAWIQKVRSE